MQETRWLGDILVARAVECGRASLQNRLRGGLVSGRLILPQFFYRRVGCASLP